MSCRVLSLRQADASPNEDSSSADKSERDAVDLKHFEKYTEHLNENTNLTTELLKARASVSACQLLTWTRLAQALGESCI